MAYDRDRLTHLNWFQKRWFLLRYDIGMAMSYLQTKWFMWMGR